VKKGPCPKCGCTIIVQGVRVLDRGHQGRVNDLSIAVYAKPDAWLFKGQVTGELWACVCGACGFTELYATNLDELIKAAAASGQSIGSLPKAEPSDSPGPESESRHEPT
jgi:predicted nucleic-acid-binding Zn-ribbon protein